MPILTDTPIHICCFQMRRKVVKSEEARRSNWAKPKGPRQGEVLGAGGELAPYPLTREVWAAV